MERGSSDLVKDSAIDGIGHVTGKTNKLDFAILKRVYRQPAMLEIKLLCVTRNEAAMSFVALMRMIVRTVAAYGLDQELCVRTPFTDRILNRRFVRRVATTAMVMVRVVRFCGNVFAAAFRADRVRMMPAATQHRVSGERNQRQSLDEAGNHGISRSVRRSALR